MRQIRPDQARSLIITFIGAYQTNLTTIGHGLILVQSANKLSLTCTSTRVIIMIAIVYTLVNTMFIAIFMYAGYQSSVQFSRHRQIRMYGCTFNYHYYLISKINQFFFSSSLSFSLSLSSSLSLPSFLSSLLLHTHNPHKRAM